MKSSSGPGAAAGRRAFRGVHAEASYSVNPPWRATQAAAAHRRRPTSSPTSSRSSSRVALLPVYTRHLTRGRLRRRRAAHDARHLRLDPRAAGDRRGVHPLLVRGRRTARAATRWPAGRRRRPAGHDRALRARRPVRRPAVRGVCSAHHDAPTFMARGARPVGVHEPRAGLRAAARRGAGQGVRDRLARQRRDDDRRHGRPRRRRWTRAPRACSRELRRARRSCSSALWWRVRHRLAGARRRRGGAGDADGCSRFGLPTVPADAVAVRANLVDRYWLLPPRERRPPRACTRSP